MPGEGTGRQRMDGVAARAWMARGRRPGRVNAARITSGRPRTAGGSETRGLPHSDPQIRERRSQFRRGVPARSEAPAAATTVARMRYPEAARLDLVEDLHGHPVADPYRWLEDAADPRTRAWTEAQDALAAEVLDRPPAAGGVRRPPGAAGARRRGRRPGLAGRAGRSPPAATRARSTRCCGCARPTAASACWSTRWRSTRPARRRSTPGRPSWEGDRLAYQLSTGGDEESTPLRARRRHRRGRSTARSTAAATPPSPGCPAARSCSTCAGSRPTRCRPARSSSTAASGATGSARRPTTTCSSTARAATRRTLLRRAHQPRRPLAGRLRLGGHRAPRRRLAGRPRRGRRAARVPGRRGRPDRRLGGPRRPALADVRPRHPALAAGGRRSRPTRPPGRRSAWRDVVPQQPDAVLSDVALVDGAGRRRCRCSPCTRSTPPTGCRSGPADGSGRLADVEGLGAGSISGVSSPPGGRDVGVGRLHRLRDAAVGAALGRRPRRPR